MLSDSKTLMEADRAYVEQGRFQWDDFAFELRFVHVRKSPLRDSCSGRNFGQRVNRSSHSIELCFLRSDCAERKTECG